MASVRSGTANMIVGHALGSMRFAAAALGWKLRLLDRVGSAAVANFSDSTAKPTTRRAEREHPELVALVVREEDGPATAPQSFQRIDDPGGQFSMVRHCKRAESVSTASIGQ